MLEHNACISFLILKKPKQAISTDTSFETKMMVKSGAIEIISNLFGWIGLAS